MPPGGIVHPHFPFIETNGKEKVALAGARQTRTTASGKSEVRYAKAMLGVEKA